MSELDYTEKYCPYCEQTKHVTEFYNRPKKYSDQLETNCKSCVRARSKEWYDSNKGKANSTNRKNHLRKTYGISLEQYDELLEKQEHKCAVCERHQDSFKARLAVDHNHKTGEIRGLLCTNCNHRLIGRHTDADRLRRMAEYISQGTGWFVPEKKRPVKRKPQRNVRQ